MPSHTENFNSLVNRIAAETGCVVSDAVKVLLADCYEDLAAEGEFYRSLNKEMLFGLKTIYRNISEDPVMGDPKAARELFSDMSTRLDEINATTKEVTNVI